MTLYRLVVITSWYIGQNPSINLGNITLQVIYRLMKADINIPIHNPDQYVGLRLF